jgi:hypothetical protein
MPDSDSLKTEWRVQPIFSKSSIFSGLALLALVLAFDRWLFTVPNRRDLPPRAATVTFQPVRLDPAGFAPLQLRGAWRVAVDDPRFGGISALAAEGGGLLALTDSGTLIRLPRPGRGQDTALVRDLPDGPGSPRFKANRDSEALARDPRGRGWWVAFENRHELWLYDRAFSRALARVRLPARGWRANKGVEAMLSGRDGLLLFHEGGREMFRMGGDAFRRQRLANRFGSLSDAVTAPDDRRLILARRAGLAGLDNRLLILDGGSSLRLAARLGLGPLDNAEALAAESLGDGGTRLWLMTDNDFRAGTRTLLVAIDLPPQP